MLETYANTKKRQKSQEGIQNSKELSKMTEEGSPKSKLFNAVNYWSYLQLVSTLIFNILAVIEIIPWLKYGSVLTIRIFQTFNNIIFSYLITNDKEIVRMIAGETARAKYFNSLVKNPHKKSISISFKNNLKLEDLNESIMSYKKMTFFEWGCMVGLVIDNEELIL
ncbi:hypothetical protein GLOIN_2v1778313 [Rhizophagus clarus]|uniref:Uncharacterized protein n=1 Tax=Rhizophagus clarus TaxID=94130 RepID=A0A8H3KY53_9GLOM|nr:hypothetical protein GLOIN_2v1778313 [Rhizophagus clarus]